MFTALRNKVKIYKLNRQEKKLHDEAKRVQKKSQEKKSPEIYDEWESSYARYEYDEIEWERKKVVSDTLIREADELNLPRPQYGDKDKWDEDRPPMVTGYVLTPESMVELRTAIRKERRERRETVEWWVKIVGGLLSIITGLVGALIGLTSVLKHK